jgi:hypothetical protein
MLTSLLCVTLLVAVTTCSFVAVLFWKPVGTVLGRIVTTDVARAWRRYLTFAIFVVGISGGARVWELEKYLTPASAEMPATPLSPDRWTFEMYRTAIGTLQGLAWLLLIFFVIALVAYMIVRARETKQAGSD